MATFPRVLLTTLVLLLIPVLRAEIGIGDSRDAVVHAFGQPVSRAQRGNREIFLYPRGGRVEFVDGRVTQVQGPLPAPSSPAPTPDPAAPAVGASATVPAAAGQPTTSAAPAPAAAKSTGLEKLTEQMEDEANPAVAAEALGQHVEKMHTAWGGRLDIPAPAPRFNGPRFAVALLLHLGITLLALRIAFKVEEMDALWSGTLAIAGIDLAVYAALEALGPATSGIASMGVVESGAGALVMVGTIQKFCFTKKLSYAVVTAMSVKLVVQLCHAFLFVLLLNALF